MTENKEEPVSEDTQPLDAADKPAPRKPARAASKTRTEPKTAVVGGGDTDPVVHSRVTPTGRVKTRKSLTVHHLQRRLTWLGFPVAAVDIDGSYGAYTLQAVEEWQESNGFPVTGDLTQEQFAAVFEDDPNVTVRIDTHPGSDAAV